MIGIAVVLVLVGGPLLIGAMGLVRARSAPEDAAVGAATTRNWTMTIASALLYVLAFNLTFFVQELFLVLPKALTPGLRPTLFHNNHHWEGDHPLASLFQGTGALAILLTGVICAVLLRRGYGASRATRLLLIWMTFNGFFQALPQVVIGAIDARNDVGMAMAFLRLSTAAKTSAALVALAAIPPIAMWLTGLLLTLADSHAQIASARARTTFIFFVATLPGLIAIPLIVAFRVPREWIEVVMPPVVVTTIGTVWMQASAWRFSSVRPRGGAGSGSVAYPLGAVLLLLFVFQVLLRPGVPFF